MVDCNDLELHASKLQMDLYQHSMFLVVILDSGHSYKFTVQTSDTNLNCFTINCLFLSSPDIRLFLSLDNPKNAQVNNDNEQFGADEDDSLV